jgi:hypothetical protein
MSNLNLIRLFMYLFLILELNPQILPMITAFGPNPFSSFIYSPKSFDENLEDNDEWLEYAQKMGRIATRECPVVLSFMFYEGDAPLSPSKSKKD